MTSLWSSFSPHCSVQERKWLADGLFWPVEWWCKRLQTILVHTVTYGHDQSVLKPLSNGTWTLLSFLNSVHDFWCVLLKSLSWHSAFFFLLFIMSVTFMPSITSCFELREASYCTILDLNACWNSRCLRQWISSFYILATNNGRVILQLLKCITCYR